MTQLLVEHTSSSWILWSTKDPHHITKSTIFGALGDHLHRLQSGDHILLDETSFDIIVIPIQLYQSLPLTITDIKSLVRTQTQRHILTHQLQSEQLYYHIYDAQVNHVASTDILWKKGQISFSLEIVLIQKTRLQELNLHPVDIKIWLYPKNRFLLRHIYQQLGQDDICVVALHEQWCTLTQTYRGSSVRNFCINIGIHTLKHILSEHRIAHQLFVPTNDLNKITLKLMHESLEFFVGQLNQWIISCIGSGHNIALISDLVKNELFVETMNQSYGTRGGWYILPRSLPHSLHKYGRNRLPSEYDVVHFWNREIWGSDRDTKG